jgi:hypothetical protein
MPIPAIRRRWRGFRAPRPRRCGHWSAGKPIKDAAARAGVDKTTLYRWRMHDPDFIQALTDWRTVWHSYYSDRMLAIADQAIEAVEGGLKKGDARLAFRLLLDLGRSARMHASRAEPPPPREHPHPHPQAEKEKVIDEQLAAA